MIMLVNYYHMLTRAAEVKTHHLAGCCLDALECAKGQHLCRYYYYDYYYYFWPNGPLFCCGCFCWRVVFTVSSIMAAGKENYMRIILFFKEFCWLTGPTPLTNGNHYFCQGLRWLTGWLVQCIQTTGNGKNRNRLFCVFHCRCAMSPTA